MNTLTLETLQIGSCLLVNIHTIHFNLLHKMSISGGWHSLTIFRLYFFPKLCSLQLRRCQNFRRISQDHAHNHLISLSIEECPQFESFLSIGLSAPLLGAENLKLLGKPMKILSLLTSVT